MNTPILKSLTPKYPWNVKNTLDNFEEKSHKYSENIMTQAWESFLFADEIKKAISKIVKLLFYDYSPERIYSLYM